MELVASDRLFMASAVMDTEWEARPTISLPVNSSRLQKMPTMPEKMPIFPRDAGSAGSGSRRKNSRSRNLVIKRPPK